MTARSYYRQWIVKDFSYYVVVNYQSIVNSQKYQSSVNILGSSYSQSIAYT